MTAGINPANVTGIVTELGGRTSHSAILSRALEIPAVVAASGILSQVKDGDEIILDGETGEIFLQPDESLKAEYEAKQAVYLKEKEEAVRIWKEIELISQKLHFPSEELNHFIRISCSYGRIKYELFAVSWQIMLCGYVADTTKKSFNRIEMDKYITAFDDLWKEWNDLSLENDNCPSMYKISSNFFGFPVGIQETIDKYRK